MREPPTVDNIRFRVIAHACAPVGMSAHRRIAKVGGRVHSNRAGFAKPLLHLYMGVLNRLRLVFFGSPGCDAANRVAEGVFYFRVEIQIASLIGERESWMVGNGDASGVFVNVPLPCRTQGRSPAPYA